MPKMWALCHSVWLLAYFSKLYTTVLCLFPVNRLLLYSISMQFASGGGGAVAQERKREGWENKASMVLSPAGPCRAAVAGASYVMWLAGPTSLFRAAAHTNPHWGTSPALEKEEEIEGELWGSQWRRCDYKNFSLSSAPNRTPRHLLSQLLFWKIKELYQHCWWLATA